jgi:hypothetical protein
MRLSSHLMRIDPVDRPQLQCQSEYDFPANGLNRTGARSLDQCRQCATAQPKRPRFRVIQSPRRLAGEWQVGS